MAVHSIFSYHASTTSLSAALTLYPPKVPIPPSAERPSTVAIESISAGEKTHTVADASVLRLMVRARH